MRTKGSELMWWGKGGGVQHAGGGGGGGGQVWISFHLFPHL